MEFNLQNIKINNYGVVSKTRNHLVKFLKLASFDFEPNSILLSITCNCLKEFNFPKLEDIPYKNVVCKDCMRGIIIYKEKRRHSI